MNIAMIMNALGLLARIGEALDAKPSSAHGGL